MPSWNRRGSSSGSVPFSGSILAQFAPGEGGAFLEEDAVRAVVGRYHELSPDQGTGWLVGFDPSFSVDPSAAVVVGRDPANRKRLVVARAERWVPRRSRKVRRAAKTEEQRLDVAAGVLDAVADLSKRYGNCPVVTDQHARALVESGLRERGVSRVIHRTWSSSSQTEAFRLLRAAIYGGTISLPISDQLQRELCRVRERTRGGRCAIELPRSVDSHCDLAFALALGLWELSRHGSAGRARVWSSFKQPRRERPPHARRPRQLPPVWTRLDRDVADGLAHSDSIANALGLPTHTNQRAPS